MCHHPQVATATNTGFMVSNLYGSTLKLHIVKPTCRQCPHPPLGHHNLWRWCAVCQILGESSWHPDRPAFVVCWSFENMNQNEKVRRCKNESTHNHCVKYKAFKYHAKWEKCESTEAAMISQPIFLKSSAASLKAMISVGHTKVKSSG